MPPKQINHMTKMEQKYFAVKFNKLVTGFITKFGLKVTYVGYDSKTKKMTIFSPEEPGKSITFDHFGVWETIGFSRFNFSEYYLLTF